MTKAETGTDKWQAEEFCALSGTDAESVRLAAQMQPIQQRAFFQTNPEARDWPECRLAEGIRTDVNLADIMASWPIRSWVGVNRSDWTVRAANFFRVPIRWTHCYLVFDMADAPRVVYEADWRGVGPDAWDKAHQADGWAWFRDVRETPESVRELWAFCQGSHGKLYSLPLLVKVAARIILQAWGLLRGLAWAEAGMASVCTSFVNEASLAVYGEAYVNRDDPSPDEIVANKHLL